MSLRYEPRGILVRASYDDKDRANWDLAPGDAVNDIADLEGTYGIVVGVFPDDNGEERALVLWSRDLTLRECHEIRDEIDQQILFDLAAQGMVSKKTLRESMGIDDVEIDE